MVERPKWTKKDKNHPQLVEECRKRGMVVWDVADLGGKVLDIIVFWKGQALPVEIKSKGNEHSLTADEEESIKELGAVGITPIVAVDIEDILSAFREKE